MKTSSLTDKQVQRIFEFTSQKYVKYYDVQLELVDHVGSQIEEMMHEDASLQFEDALQQVYKSFGVFGFTKVGQEKMGEISKQWTSKFWSYLKSYFSFPKVLLTLLLTVCYFNVLRFMPEIKMSSLLWIPLTMGVGVALQWSLMTYFKKGNEFNSKRIVAVESFNFVRSSVGYWFYVPLQMLPLVAIDYRYNIVISFILALFTILGYGVMAVFPKWLEEDVEKNYAHLNLTAG